MHVTWVYVLVFSPLQSVIYLYINIFLVDNFYIISTSENPSYVLK